MRCGKETTEYQITLVCVAVNTLLIIMGYVDAALLGALNAVPLVYVGGRSAIKSMKGES